MPPKKQPTATTAKTAPTRVSSRKRAASPEPMLPAPKRATKENAAVKPPAAKKTDAPLDSTPVPKKRGRPATKRVNVAEGEQPREHDEPPPKKRVRKSAEPAEPLKQPTPYLPPKAMNALPIPPNHTRPGAQLFVWGAGNFGQFGMGHQHLGEFEKPKKNTWMEMGMQESKFGGEGAGIEAVAAGGLHTMFIDEAGRIWTCGVNDDAALGRPVKDVPDPDNPGHFLNTDILTSTPHVLQSLADENFRAVGIAAGDSISAAISTNGSLRVWGSFKANEGALGFSSASSHQWTPVPMFAGSKREACVAIANGNNHLLVLTASGAVYAWGAAEQGQLGRKILERRKINGVQPERVIIGKKSRKSTVIGAGSYTSYVVDSDGLVWGWGLNNMGQTGTSDQYDDEEPIVMAPKQVKGLSPQELGGARVVQINGGEHHTLFLTSDGRLFACGRGDGGQLGLPLDHPVVVERVQMLGENGTLDYIITPTELKFPVDTKEDPIVSISAGIRNNLAISRDGALYSWGEGNQGELGLGDETNAQVPTVLVRRTGGAWAAVGAACGGQHTLGMFRKKE
ncbi:RCC1/BLIP-II protein [Sistotremastrum suecicum HHB10207 ss-3]|uniref:RCC1/BLIP-II protein n=1 Tax=Sistotremastrum suecicum HHB10207 ss-3 TaxID=1314776 RepID=A0A166EIV5_9AGAM|nr:RCC1/BLIP-II protein [Sistotremastrum suecicum HHB10207 ss-3]